MVYQVYYAVMPTGEILQCDDFKSLYYFAKSHLLGEFDEFESETVNVILYKGIYVEWDTGTTRHCCHYPLRSIATMSAFRTIYGDIDYTVLHHDVSYLHREV